ncbi:MAG: 2,3-bisphosphoglycerate-independent phosphoglycerate mutase [Thermoanaerobacteraceae bacterium]|nr:2,3-bisphosphoglycerate-independent phosphoglycerate mutase [Thermoanaerobacteraceae bacterium]
MTVSKPLILMILDGWGMRDEAEGNAIKKASIPNFQRLWREYPHTKLKASGEAVGLPEGQMGNSEVGHLNLGAGRIVYQEITRINRAIKEGSFFENEALVSLMEQVKAQGKSLHLMGLLSDGGVHSHIEHLYALLEMAKQHGLEKVYIHAFLDGRDVPPANAAEYFDALQQKCRELQVGKVATVMGRYYAMDRDERWERVARAFKAMVLGEGLKATFPKAALERSYDKRVTDEFVEPTVMVDERGNPVATVRSGDGVIFYNFRADRARQITRAFVDKDFQGFERPEGFQPVPFVCMTQYDADIKAPVAFPPQNLENTLGEYLSQQGYKQLRIAETEKYAHVTFFFNGGVEEPNEGEDRILIPSPKVATYNQKPEMSAYEVTDKVLEKIDEDKYDVIILNFANPDMVGHTGIEEAAVKALEAVDECIGRIYEKMRAKGAPLIITADHGNVEKMVDLETGEPHTAHTESLVPFILVVDSLKNRELADGGALKDVAPTMLQLLNLDKPADMIGESLIK